jgi:hypothetical protein
MRRRPSGLRMVINRPSMRRDFESAGSRFDASICSRHGYLHSATPASCLLDSFTRSSPQRIDLSFRVSFRDSEGTDGY